MIRRQVFSIHTEILAVEFSKLSEPPLIFMAQLLVNTLDILICELFLNIATLISFRLDKLHHLLRGQFSLISSHVDRVILVDSA